MEKGKIDVTTENIFPIIKKFLYSDHEIFLRELISNAVDATQKLKAMASMGDYKEELGDLTIRVSLDKKKKTLTVSDFGIGMSAEEIDKYINQIAFSSAEDFLEKYKNQANSIIGHFGLGFYSSFMVSKKVEIVSKSCKGESPAVKWTCDGTPDYTLDEAKRDRRGTDVILHFDKESEEFADESRIEGILKKHCRFLPVPIAFGKETEWKDGKSVETGEDKIINDTNPLWTRKPVDLKDEDYQKFYHDLYPMVEDPLFNIHLNVDYPFNLTGILYFPKIRNNFEIQKNKIQLYCNQVFVTDSVEGIVPEFLTLLHGVIDSPDIPLNVSRSYLQSDSNVKKIASHITKKVADRLQEIFKNDREQFEKKWDDLKVFIEYGMMTEEKFYDQISKIALYKNTEGKYFTFEEYETLIKENQKDKNGTLVYLYTTNKEEQFSFIESARAKGYDVLMMDGYLDTHFINHVESKLKNSHFVRVDSDVIDKLIMKEEKRESKLSEQHQNELSQVFKSQLPGDQSHFSVVFESLDESDSPVVITQSEYMRRMKDMSQLGGPASFYGNLPDHFTMVVNANHPLVQKVNEDKEKKCRKDLDKYDEKIKPIEDNKKEIEEANKGKKDEEIPQADKDRITDLDKKVKEFSDKKNEVLSGFGSKYKLVKQLIDIALLSNNMLKGEDLNRFIKRSIELL
ncbi:MAG: molecular chaperone HtpG [Bacteroidales bacterium]|nr:molecular chaperone HtpG [Bacteroidales bacterium]MBN2762666.1 molecular chaperone HtpG [Bacteroidales bacterium]